MMYKEIGHVIKPHGLKGEVVVLVEAFAADRVQSLSTIFLDLGGSKVPFLLQRVSPLRPGQFKLRLTGVETQEETERLRKLPVYCLRDDIPDEEDTDLTGFILFNRGVEVGKVLAVIDNSLQVLLEIKTETGESYVPLTSDWILGVDAEAKKLDMDLPEGLLDI